MHSYTDIRSIRLLARYSPGDSHAHRSCWL
jgi:hypothetical protein